MITKFTREALKEAIENEDFIYEYTTHVADKLRAIYTLFGWVHMLESFDEAQDTIDELMSYVYKEIVGGRDTCMVSTAGLTIEAWIDEEDMVNIDYYFNLA